MTARISYNACPSGKVRYRNRVAAIGGRCRTIQGARRAGSRCPDLWFYRCRIPTCRGWHLTSRHPDHWYARAP